MERFVQMAEADKVEYLLKGHKNYMAHTPDETLSDHMKLVDHYFQDLVRVHGLEPLIDGLLIRLCDNNENLTAFAKKLFWQAILYHDFGKVNENFQRVKMGNGNHFPESVSNGIDTQHSVLSAFLFLVHQLSDGMSLIQKESEQAQQKIIQLIFGLAHNIIRHHSAYMDDLSSPGTFEKYKSELCGQLEVYLRCYHPSYNQDLPKHLPSVAKQIRFQQLGFEWFALIRLNFSLLTAADYYATSHFCSQWSNHYREFGVLTDEQKQKHFSSLQHTQDHNKLLYQSYEEIARKSFHDFQDKSPENLNQLRSKMAAEVVVNVRRNATKRLFYIEAPTGGGKTNMAFIATMELLQKNPELSKVFYVFPFTTLATQTQKAAEETLGLKNNEYIELHSRAAWKQKEEVNDGLYGGNRLDDIHNQFVNYPYTFLSHVRFFDILKANDKSSIYLMHRLANSIVVIDEVQAYNPELWDKMAYLLKEYSQALNIRFIVMSATLPKIGDLTAADFCYLLPNAIGRFFVNPNFAQRVNFSDELLSKKRPTQEQREEYLNWLTQAIYEKSEKYKENNGCVRTIVEFIFKKSATEFAALAKKMFHDYEIQVLSGTILEPRRKHIIQDLKSKSNQVKNILLITTQVVEAGVDIDMDMGFKNRSIIDSEEQLAGRVNRNVKKEGCMVYLFDLDDAAVIYGKDLRYKEVRKSLEKDYFDILKTKRFDLLYNKVKEWLDKTNREKGLAGTGSDYQNRLIGQMDFPSIDKEFTLIEQSNTSVFVPLDLPAKAIFTKQQLQFLEEYGIYPSNDKISGVEVFDLYRSLIVDKSIGFIVKRRNLKILQSVMSMYIFSLFSESTAVKEILSLGNPFEFGYLYLLEYKTLYSYTYGFNDALIPSAIIL